MAATGTSNSAQPLSAAALWLARSALAFFASLKLAVILLPLLASVLARATILETKHSAEYARWFVYESWWFVALLALLGVNIFCAAISRIPWKRHHTGFVVTHAGLLVLLAGSVQSFLGGVEGRVSLVEGETASDMVLARTSQITAFWIGRPQEPPFEFTFAGGPVDWATGSTLNIGRIDGVQARILGYFRRALATEAWVPDPSGRGGPAVKFKFLGPGGVQVAEGWLIDQQFGDAVAVGPVRLQLQQAVSDRMLDDFLQPRMEELGEKGLLLMYLGEAIERVRLDQRLGEKIAIGTGGVTVEVVEYLANASPDKLGHFTSKGDQPKNPMVELRVHMPGAEQPLRQIAFAKDPLLNLDGVYPTSCPVKFRFHHPAIKPQTATIELVQSSQGKLFGRAFAAESTTAPGELHNGDQLVLPGGFILQIVEHIPHAKRKVAFTAEASPPNRSRKDQNEPAALVEISAGGLTEQVWMRRNDADYGKTAITTPAGTLALKYEYGRVPLGFSIKLLDFHRERNPGGAGNAAFSSKVQVIDSRRGLDQERVIAMNQPLKHGNFTFYQSSFDDAGHGSEASTFSVAYDPGRTLKYTGSLMICCGIAIMFFMRAYFFKKRPRWVNQPLPLEQSHAPVPRAA